MKATILVAITLAAGLAACSPKPAAPEGPVATASVHELMTAVVDPLANAVWNAPPSISDPEAAAKAAPEQIDADWKTLRRNAVALAESANLLVMDGRKVVAPGAKLQGEGLEGNLPPEKIAARMTAERGKWVQYAKALQAASLETVATIDRKNPDQLLEVGGKIQEACEACHKEFWYPEAVAPK